MRKSEQAMQIATAQEQEKVASYRHVDLTQWQRREVRLHVIKAIQVIFWSICS
jgi:hypothetical protein